MANLTSQLLVRLIDGVSGPARKAAGALRGISAAAQRINAAQVGVRAAIDRNNAALDKARGRLVDAAALGYALARSLSAPVKAGIDFQTQLEDIGQKAEIPQQKLAALGARIRKVAADTNQAASQMAKGMDVLVGFGASEGDALALLRPIGRAATAYNAAIEDLSQASYAALLNLKVPADQVATALDAMAQAGKSGAFELADMARYAPAIFAAYQGLGQKGVPAVADLAAAMQVARMGAGDAAEAATNLSNVLQKINAPMTRKAFKKLGVNLEREMKKAAEKGLTPIEAIAEITNRTLKGDLSKLGDLFQDAQVQKGLRAIIQNMEEYRKIRAEALKAQGVVEEDYQRRLKTTAGHLQRFHATMENLNASLGAALLPAVNAIADRLSQFAARAASFAEAHPEIARNVTMATAALIGFRVAAAGSAWIGLQAKGAMLQIASAALAATRSMLTLTASVSRLTMLPLLPFGRALGLIAPSARGAARATATQAAAMLTQRQAAFQAALALQAMASKGQVVGVSMAQATAGVRSAGAALVAAQADMKAANAALAATGSSVGVVTRAFRVLKMALIGSGIGLAIAGIAAAGVWIYNNWTGISTAFEAFKGAFSRAIEPVMPAIQPMLDGFSWLLDTVSGLLGPIDEMGGGWTRAGLAAGKFVGEAVRAVIELPGKITALAGDMLEVGKSLGRAIYDGVAELVSELAAYIKSKLSDAISSVGSAARRLGSKITFGLISSGDEPAAIPQRARGGPLNPGQPTLVGERGPEIITASRSGYVHPNDKLGGLGGGITINQTISPVFNGITEVSEIMRALERTLADGMRSSLRGVYADYGFGFKG